MALERLSDEAWRAGKRYEKANGKKTLVIFKWVSRISA
jgi:hypothetical protein